LLPQLESKGFNQSTFAIHFKFLPPLPTPLFLMEIASKQVLPNNFLKELLSTNEILRDKECLFIEGDGLCLARFI
jgi:hypothetical protein